MKVDLENIIPISKVNQNFSSASRATDKFGSIVIMKNNNPKYVLMTIEEYQRLEHRPEAKDKNGKR